MRSLPPLLAAILVLAVAAPAASGQGGGGTGVGTSGAGVGNGTAPGPTPAPVNATTARANRQLDGSLNLGMRQSGRFSGAYVVDLTANRTLYSKNAATDRLPASVEKL